MPAEPQRAAQPHHLNPHIIPVERALLARAKAIEEAADILDSADREGAITLARIASEFRDLAAELHHW